MSEENDIDSGIDYVTDLILKEMKRRNPGLVLTVDQEESIKKWKEDFRSGIEKFLKDKKAQRGFRT